MTKVASQITGGKVRLFNDWCWDKWMAIREKIKSDRSKNTLINPTETKVCHFGHGAKTRQTGSLKRVNK